MVVGQDFSLWLQKNVDKRSLRFHVISCEFQHCLMSKIPIAILILFVQFSFLIEYKITKVY